MAIQSRLPAFLLTRPSAQSQRFADMLRHRFGPDLTIVISPLMEPEFPKPQVPAGAFSAAIFTSETGVRAYRQNPELFSLGSRTTYCVGDRTAKAAQTAGLTPVSAGGDADALVALLLSLRPSGRLLHLCGSQTRGDVAKRLTQGGVPTVACTTYQQIERPLTSEAISLLAGERQVWIPLFSPRSANLFLAQIAERSPKAPLVYVALSKAVAEPLLSQSVRLIYAKEPHAAGMLKAVAGGFDATQIP